MKSKTEVPLETLLKDTTKQEAFKWCYPLHHQRLRDIGSSEIRLWRNGLLVVNSNLYPFLKRQKETLYFRAEFDADSTRCEITFLDPKISFEDFIYR